jgi:hypothetical protein
MYKLLHVELDDASFDFDPRESVEIMHFIFLCRFHADHCKL